MAEAGDLGGHLVAGQLTTLAGLGALRHFDLQLVGEDAVLGSDAEAPRCDLFDAGVPVDRRALAAEAPRILPALAGVALATEPVHRDRDRLVRLGGDRAVRHRAGRKPTDDRLDRFDLR